MELVPDVPMRLQHAGLCVAACHSLRHASPRLPSPPLRSGAPLVAAFLPTEAHLQEVQNFDERRRCRVCGATFSSRSKLFDHLRHSGHEADQTNPALLNATLRLGRGAMA